MEHLLKYMKTAGDGAIQLRQLKHRKTLAEAFGVNKGMRILEVGCGQGDTTIVLAEMVGPGGHVTAVDIANPDYGFPFTLGEATASIQQSPLGDRIEFLLQTDLLDVEVEEPFDMVVFSHCSWYFRDPEQLKHYFMYSRKIARWLCIAEWDMQYTRPTQQAHFLSAAIMALYSQFIDNDGNIQHVYGKRQLIAMLQESGFTLERQTTAEASYLDDGSWEMASALALKPEFNQVPPRIRTLAETFFEMLESIDAPVKSLDSAIIIGKGDLAPPS